tara:strand:+ start:921 stop:1166 length:246 start_codon:yes stop_codon:yes gene_type:complete
MAVTVKTNTNRGITVAQGAGATGSITVTKSTGGKLQSLADVNTTNLEDGYTIIYDTTTNKWVSQAITLGTVSVTNVDGGTY